LFKCNVALDIVQLQDCTECYSNATLGSATLHSMRILVRGDGTVRLPGSQLPMKMSDHFGAIINAIMHFKKH